MAGGFARRPEEIGGFRGVVGVVFDLGCTVIRGSVLQYIQHILSGHNPFFFLQSQVVAQDSEMLLNGLAALPSRGSVLQYTEHTL